MRLVLILLLMASPAIAQTFDPTAYNGSACTGVGTPHAGCSIALSFPNTDSANTNAQTQIPVAAPKNYNASDISAYLYAGANPGKMAHWQPWWGCSSHPNIGYNENQTATVTAQLAAMKALGFGIVVPDYYGNHSTKSCNLASVNKLASLLTANSMKMVLGLDQGSWNSGAGSETGSHQCPPGSGITTAQMITCWQDQLDNMAANYLFQSYYETFGGKPIVTTFLDETSWPSVNWTTVYTTIHAHIQSGQSCSNGGLYPGCTYSSTVLLLGRNSGSITQSGMDGGFAWSPTQAWSNSAPSTQLDWNGTSGYLDNFYSVCRANPTKLCIGLLEKGFDNTPTSFGNPKIIAQQCGQLPKLSAGKIASAGYSSSSQLAYIQAQTWNDYEEGTELETGIDNCIRVSASISGQTLNWSLPKTDSTYATTSTIDRLQVLYGTGNSVQVGIDNIPASQTSQSLSTIPDGTWTIYLRALGKPLIQNQLSLPLTFNSHINRVVSHTIGGGRVVH